MTNKCPHCHKTIEKRPVGRPARLPAEKIAKLRLSGWSINDLAVRFQCSRTGIIKSLERSAS